MNALARPTTVLQLTLASFFLLLLVACRSPYMPQPMLLVSSDRTELAATSFEFAAADTSETTTKDFTLPIKGASGSVITWISNHPELLSIASNGKVTVIQPPADTQVTLTATIASNGTSTTKTIILIIKQGQSHTVAYDSQSATSAASPATTTVTGPTTTVATLPSDPSKTGYSFGGWFTATSGDGSQFLATTTVSADITVYAKWTAIDGDGGGDGGGGDTTTTSYTVSFDCQGGSAVASAAIASGALVSTPTPSTQTGYSFGGWYKEAACSTSWDFATDKVTAASTLYAKWVAISHTVTYDSQSATTAASPASSTVTSPSTTVSALPSDPAKTGYSFGGWFTAINGGGSQFLATTTVRASLTVYSKWTGIDGSGSGGSGSGDTTTTSYTVSFDCQGGSAVASAAIASGALVSTPTPSTQTGYSFGGWYKEAACSTSWDFATDKVTAASTLYAKWVAISHTVTYDSQSATTAASPASSTVTSPATTVSALPSNPVKTGYSFSGWFTAINGSGSQFLATTTVRASLTVYSKWTGISYAITYNLDSGTNSGSNPASYTIASDAITLADPSKSGYSFGGWYSDSSFGTKITSIAAGSSGNKVLYAKWLVGGTVTASISIPTDGTVTLPTVAANLTVAKGSSLTVAVSETVGATYSWYLDGNVITGISTKTATLPTTGLTTAAGYLSVGRHELMVEVTKSGSVYSNRCTVKVTN